MESISEKFFAVVNAVVPLHLSEGETQVYPYGVYEHRPAYSYDKDGPYKVTSDVVCDIYGKDFDDIERLAESAVSAVSGQMNDGRYTSALTYTEKTCYEGVWNISLTFKIKENL